MIFKTACLLCLAVVFIVVGGTVDNVFGLVIESEFETAMLSVYISEVSFRQDSDEGWTDADVAHVKTASGTITNVDFGGLTLKSDEKAYFRVRIRCGASSIYAYTRATLYSYVCEYDFVSDTVGSKIPDIQPAALTWSDVRGVYDDGSSFPMQFSASSMTRERTVMLFNRYIEPGHYFDLYFDIDPRDVNYIPGRSAVGIGFEIDGIQTHNIVECMKSSWGVDVTLQPDGSIWLDSDVVYPISRYFSCCDFTNFYFPVDVPCTFVLNKQVQVVDP